MDAVRKHFRHLGLAGPSVAHVAHVLDALRADGLINEQAAWNRQNLAQGRIRAFICAWRDVRATLCICGVLTGGARDPRQGCPIHDSLTSDEQSAKEGA